MTMSEGALDQEASAPVALNRHCPAQPASAGLAGQESALVEIQPTLAQSSMRSLGPTTHDELPVGWKSTSLNSHRII